MADSASASASYIHLVHHLIEECILFNMTKEECVEALSKHADIKPVITATVWKELEKENREFFEAYEKRIQDGTVSSENSETNSLRIQHGITNTNSKFEIKD